MYLYLRMIQTINTPSDFHPLITLIWLIGRNRKWAQSCFRRKKLNEEIFRLNLNLKKNGYAPAYSA